MGEELRLGQTVCSVSVRYHPARYDSESDFPDGYEVFWGRVLAASDEQVALVTDGGRVAIRPRDLVFADRDEAERHVGPMSPYDLEQKIIT